MRVKRLAREIRKDLDSCSDLGIRRLVI